MELDKKQQVLVAIYTEYQKDLPNMSSVNHESLEMDEEIFVVALEKLLNEGLIIDVDFYLGGDYSLQTTKMTSYGLNYVEEKLGIEPTLSGAEKVKEVAKQATQFGYNELKDFASKVVAELLKG
ncbi:YjcQ family protein [Bacillus sp. SA1-12]|uniref:YjcQ family protein n=1 Tax=Bacillus sp. SA1-12 TaxID=1455638 RepID=UPI0006971146|nr:YjcQ family protein [Bacillus sp. SA1-12]